MRPERRRVDAAFTLAARAAGAITIAVPVAILAFVAWHGRGVIAFAFLSQPPGGYPLGTAGGIGPAIAGSLALVGLGLVVAAPAGIGAAAFLAEYGRGRTRDAAAFAVECLAATPSIVYGLAGYALLVVQARLGISLAAGALTLAATMLPIILIGTHAALQAGDAAEREAALALGVSRWHALRRIAARRAWPGIVAALVLAAAHAFGSAAPVLFTASVVHSRGGLDLALPVMTLPTHLYYLVGEATSFQHAYGTALVLLAVLLAGNAAAMGLKRWGAAR
jgi:phosphate transport system permease protein